MSDAQAYYCLCGHLIYFVDFYKERYGIKNCEVSG